MGFLKPSAPKPPDYTAAAKEQGVANTNSALATNHLNQVNQVGPDGNLTFSYSTPGTPGTPGTPYQAAVYDKKGRLISPEVQATEATSGTPDSGGGYTLPDGTYIPRTTATTTLSADQQKLYDQNMTLGTGLNDLAIRGVDYVDNATANPLKQDDFRDVSYGPTVLPTNQAAYQTNADPFQTNADPFQTNADPFQTNARSFQTNADPFQTNASQYQMNPDQFQTDNGTGGLQYNYDFAGAGKMPSSSDFTQDRDLVTQALLARMQPQLDQDQQRLDSRLANQGINLGSQAYGDANFNRDRGVNDARIAALLAGSQEQQRMFGNAMGIRQQGIGEAVSQGNFNNAARGQAFAQNLGANAQNFAQGLGARNQNFAMNAGANAQNFGMNATANNQNFGMNATANNQNFGMNAAANNQNFGMNATANNQNFGMNLGANNQNFGQDLGANNQNFNMGLARSQFDNQALNQDVQMADFFQNQPLNVLNALRTGNQVSMPQFQNWSTGAQVAPPPIYAAANDQYQGALQAYQAKSGMFGDFLGGLGGLGAAGIKQWG